MLFAIIPPKPNYGSQVKMHSLFFDRSMDWFSKCSLYFDNNLYCSYSFDMMLMSIITEVLLLKMLI